METSTYALKSKSAEEVTLFLFFYQLEALKWILTDQGKGFVKEVTVKNYWNAKVISNIYSKKKRSKLVKNKPEKWDKHLDAVMYGLRTKRQMTTKFSSFFLMFSREARDPSLNPCWVHGELHLQTYFRQKENFGIM